MFRISFRFSISITLQLHDPKKCQLKVDFLSVPYNQTFVFVTGQFVKILTPACLWKMSKNDDNS